MRSRTNVGLYDFSAVPPGVYTVKAELTGFKTFENKGVRVGTQQFVTMDIKLDVGQLQETITVTGEAPLIDTSNASTGGVIDSRAARDAAERRPLGVPVRRHACPRWWPRATRSSTASRIRPTRRCCRSAAARAAPTTTWWTACRSPTCATAPRRTRRIEALEGVNVQVHQYDAETGRTGGGTFNVATKSGGNDWHGSGFYQTRPRWGTANNFFSSAPACRCRRPISTSAAAASAARSSRTARSSGSSVEGYGSNTTRNGALRVPTAREKAGDFSQTLDSAGKLQS